MNDQNVTGLPRLSTSYHAIHTYLRKHFGKTGQCIRCERTDCRTEFALIHGRQYSRLREDYLELCVPCHRRYDGNLPPVHSGDSHHSVKLTEADVIEARLLYATGGWTMQALARKYGVSRTPMRKAILGITWASASEDELLARADHIFGAVDNALGRAA